MKKMPRTLYLSLFLCLIGLVSGLLLGGLNSITAPIIEENKMKEIAKSFEELGVTDLSEVENKIDSVVNAYAAKFNGVEVYVVTATDTNQFTEVQVIAVIEKTTGKVLNAKVTGNPSMATHMSDAEFTNDKLGIIGAVMGLIQVMQNLSDPSKLGAGIAVAFVATIYGLFAANLLMIPLSTRIKFIYQNVFLYKNIILEGVLSIQAGESPVLIERKLRSFILETNTEAKE